MSITLTDPKRRGMPWGNHLGRNWGWSGGWGGGRGWGSAHLDRKLYCGFQEEEEQGGGVSRLRIDSFKRSRRLGADWALPG